MVSTAVSAGGTARGDSWATPMPVVVAGLLVAGGLAAWVLLGVTGPTGSGPDGAGLLLLGVAAVAIGLASVVGLRARPRLAATGETLELRSTFGLRRWPWERVDAVRSVRIRRIGLPTAYLEIDARDEDGTERLLVLGRLELGTDPVEVADALQAHRASAGRATLVPDDPELWARPSGWLDEREREDPQGDDDQQGGGDPGGDDEARGRP